MVLGRDELPARVVVPDHRQIRKGTLRQILQDADLTVEEFLDLI